jgi:DNA-binding MarR family transcriptional regulator
MTRANKILIKLGLIKLTIDNTDGRHRILTLTDKGKALKLDLINTLTK